MILLYFELKFELQINDDQYWHDWQARGQDGKICAMNLTGNLTLSLGRPSLPQHRPSDEMQQILGLD